MVNTKHVLLTNQKCRWGLLFSLYRGQCVLALGFSNTCWKTRFWRVLKMVCNTQNYWDFGLYTLSDIKKSKEHTILETGTVSFLRIQRLRLALSKGCNRVGVSPLIRGPEHRFLKCFVLWFLNTGWWTGSKNAVLEWLTTAVQCTYQRACHVPCAERFAGSSLMISVWYCLQVGILNEFWTEMSCKVLQFALSAVWTSKLAQAVMLLTHIVEVLGSNLGWDSDCLSCSFQGEAGTVPWAHICFLPSLNFYTK
jgi:hypothetical protein